MLSNDDFFSPEQIDEQLAVSGFMPPISGDAREEEDVNLLLLSDLRTLYGRERVENARSLEQVWTRLEAEHTGRQDTAKLSAEISERRLYVIKPREQSAPPPIRQPRRVHGRSWAALAASLVVLLLVGGMLLVLRQAHTILGAVNSAPTPTPVSSIPGYPSPGHTLATSPAFPDGFSALSWAPDGKRLAMATQNEAWTWDLTTSRYAIIVQAIDPGTRLQALAWSPDGRYLAIGTNPVQIFDLTSNSNQPAFTYPIYTFWPQAGNDYQAAVTALAWSSDSSYLAIAALRSSNAGCVVQIRSTTEQTKLVSSMDCEASPSGVNSLSWSLEGQDRYLAFADGQTVQVRQVLPATPKAVFAQVITGTTNVAWLPGSLAQLAFVNSATAQVWDVASRAMVSRPIPAANGVLTLSPDGRYLATANGNEVSLWDSQTGEHLYTYTGHVHPVSSLAWSPDGTALASAESSDSTTNVARIWSA